MRNTGIVTELEVAGEQQSLEKKVALALYRIAQEGLTNVRKHAHASRVDVLLDFSPSAEVRLEIKDNGVGATEITATDGFGLVGIRERVHLLNGKLDIHTSMGKGFCLQVAVPIQKPPLEIA